MSAVSATADTDPPLAGGALPGVGLLRVVQCFMRTAMAAARSVTRIAQQKVMGEDLSRLAPAGFNATATYYLLVEAVAWTAALRERLRARAGRPVAPLAPGLPKSDRAPQGRGAAQYVTVTYETTPGDWHDWSTLTKPLRIGRRGVAMALLAIAGKSDRAVVSHICDYLRRVVCELGAEANVARISALEAAALALCPEAKAAPEGDDPAGAKAAPEGDDDPGGAKAAPEGANPDGAKATPPARAAGPSAVESGAPAEQENAALDDPPQRPPDG